MQPEIEEVLFQWVKDQPTITSLIGAEPQPVRFFKGQAPQGSKTPGIIVRRQGSDRQQLACGPDGAVLVELQVDHYAKTWAEMARLAKSFRQALNPNPTPYPAFLGSGDSPGVQMKVKSATCENEFDADDPEPGLFRRVQFWRIWVWET